MGRTRCRLIQEYRVERVGLFLVPGTWLQTPASGGRVCSWCNKSLKLLSSLSLALLCLGDRSDHPPSIHPSIAIYLSARFYPFPFGYLPSYLNYHSLVRSLLLLHVLFVRSTIMGGAVTTSLLGAFEAGVSVLLTLAYGLLAARLQLVRPSTARDVSKLCVHMFLPALLVVNVGSQLHVGSIGDYVPIFRKSFFFSVCLFVCVAGWLLNSIYSC